MHQAHHCWEPVECLPWKLHIFIWPSNQQMRTLSEVPRHDGEIPWNSWLHYLASVQRSHVAIQPANEDPKCGSKTWLGNPMKLLTALLGLSAEKPSGHPTSGWGALVRFGDMMGESHEILDCITRSSWGKSTCQVDSPHNGLVMQTFSDFFILSPSMWFAEKTSDLGWKYIKGQII